MSAVRPRIVLLAGAAAAWMAALSFGACRSGPQAPADGPPTRDGPIPPTAPLGRFDGGVGPRSPSPLRSAEAGPAEASPAGDAGSANAKWRCPSPRSALLNLPDGGVVFNNAMTSADAGFIDRTQGIIDALVGQSQAIRCCFDEWAEQHPGDEGQVVLLLELDAAGVVISADVDPRRSTIAERATLDCLIEVARRASYPESPTGSPTLVEYPFVVALRAP